MTVLAQDLSYQLLAAFSGRFSERHVVLAMHAALPLGLTPEMLHLIRINFVPDAPWMAEVDLLLSSLCREAGDEMYSLKPEVRDMLLRELKLDAEFGQKRLQELAGFLYAFTERELNATHSKVRRQFLEAQQLAAVAFLQPQRAAQAIARELQQAQQSADSAELQRLGKVTEALAEPLIAEDDLLIYVAGLEHHAAGNEARAREAFALLGGGSAALVAGVALQLPVSTPTVGTTDPVTEQTTTGSQLENDLYISFCTADDFARNNSNDGQILMLHEDLGDSLGLMLGRGSGIGISQNTPELNEEAFAKNIDERRFTLFPDTAIFMPALSAAYLSDDRCLHELQEIVRILRNGGLTDQEFYTRFILLLLEPLPEEQIPVEIRPCQRIMLYTQPSGATVQRLHREETGEALDAYRRRVGEIVTLTAAKLAGIPDSRPLGLQNYIRLSHNKLVFLAEATPDLVEQREALAATLRENGFTILPHEPPGYAGHSGAARAMLLEKVLPEVLLYIQFIGSEATPAMDDGYSSTASFDLAFSANIGRRNRLQRVFWTPANDSEERALGQLRRIDTLRLDSEILRAGLKDVVDRVQSLLPANAAAEEKEKPGSSATDREPSGFFINYRRRDSGSMAQELNHRLGKNFGPEAVTLNVPFSSSDADVRTLLRQEIARRAVVLVLIGPAWLVTTNTNGERSIDSPEDLVRLEIETALGLEKIVIPVLLQEERMPDFSELPESIQNLARFNAASLRNDDHYEADLQRLFAELQRYGNIRPLDETQESTPDNKATSGDRPKPDKPAIFINYRRGKSTPAARLLRDSLGTRFGENTIAWDMEILAGVDFRELIRHWIASCEVMLVLIDEDWLTISDSRGQRRLDDPADMVRLETAAALQLNKYVIPVLLDGAEMPREADLPEELRPLARRQALVMKNDVYEYDLQRLIAAIEQAAPNIGSEETGGRQQAASGSEEIERFDFNAYIESDVDASIAGRQRLDREISLAHDAINQAGGKAAALEDEILFVPGGADLDAPYKLGGADLLVLIIGNSSGPGREGEASTIYEQAYNMAAKSAIPRLIFVVDPLQSSDRGIAGFLQNLPPEQDVHFYSRPEEIPQQMPAALKKLKPAILQRRSQRLAEAPTESAEPQQTADIAWSVYLSSSYDEMKDENAIAREVILAQGNRIAGELEEVSKAGSEELAGQFNIGEADVFIQILGDDYGFIPEGEQRSLLEMEYQTARDLELPLLIFMPPQRPAGKVSKQRQQNEDNMQAYKQRIIANQQVYYYHSPEELRQLLPQALRGATEAIRKHQANRLSGPGTAGETPPVQQQQSTQQQEPVESPPAPDTFRHPLDGSVYILVSGGSYAYSQTGREVSVPGLWFARFPVTNRQYRRFIDYLQGRLPEVEKELSLEDYAGWVRTFAAGIEGFERWLPGALNLWPGQFRSEYDTDAAFSSDDQPVVGISWYAARAYCLWLSMQEQQRNFAQASTLYRLPTEQEWEWAAAGREPGRGLGRLRTYPWDPSLGEPWDKLANFGQNVGSTTPVGNYPNNNTPEGLMDMAGNVWELMENDYEEGKSAKAIRGGSYNSEARELRCNTRNFAHLGQRTAVTGFRVVREVQASA